MSDQINNAVGLLVSQRLKCAKCILTLLSAHPTARMVVMAPRPAVYTEYASACVDGRPASRRTAPEASQVRRLLFCLDSSWDRRCRGCCRHEDVEGGNVMLLTRLWTPRKSKDDGVDAEKMAGHVRLSVCLIPRGFSVPQGVVVYVKYTEFCLCECHCSSSSELAML